MATHTPGPWSNNKWNCEEHQISAMGGTIALVSHSHSLVSEESADANGRLIAAAPDLLACCLAANDLLQNISHYVPDEEFEDEPNVNTVRHLLEAAVSKATGSEVPA